MSSQRSRSARPYGVVALVAALGMLVPAGEAAAVTPKEGFYKGLTTQGANGAQCYGAGLTEVPCGVTFRVRKRVVRRATFSIAWPNCSTSFPMSPFTGRVRPDGRFTIREGEAVMKGRFVSSTRVKGTVTGRPVASGRFPGCDVQKTVGFTARRRSA
jgi:hypothetical protein